MRLAFATSIFAALCFGSRALAVAIAGNAVHEAVVDPRGVTSPPAKNPIILLHGVGGNGNSYMVPLKLFLQNKGYTVFSPTYGAWDAFGLVGGLQPVANASRQVADIIRSVRAQTGAAKVDLIGHSGGAFLTLYAPLFEDGVAPSVERVVAVSPATHGTDTSKLMTLAETLGIREQIGAALRGLGCPACDDYSTGGAAVMKLAARKGPLAQPGNKVTIVATRYDTVVTPYETAFVDEEGIANVLLQDVCGLDVSGHIGEATSPNLWGIIMNALEETPDRKRICVPFGGLV